MNIQLHADGAKYSTKLPRSDKEMMVGDLLTTKEAAELLRVSHWTVSAWLSQGKLKRVKAGGRTLIAKTDLEAFLKQSSASQSVRN
jgi:excisionase family DNA binding protein